MGKFTIYFPCSIILIQENLITTENFPSSEGVRCYTEREFTIDPYFTSYRRNEKTGELEKIGQTLVLSCGMYDGEDINLFDLADWFEKHKDWINEQRKHYLEDKS